MICIPFQLDFIYNERRADRRKIQKLKKKQQRKIKNIRTERNLKRKPYDLARIRHNGSTNIVHSHMYPNKKCCVHFALNNNSQRKTKS